jgi:hypothetical protein
MCTGSHNGGCGAGSSSLDRARERNASQRASSLRERRCVRAGVNSRAGLVSAHTSLFCPTGGGEQEDILRRRGQPLGTIGSTGEDRPRGEPHGLPSTPNAGRQGHLSTRGRSHTRPLLDCLRQRPARSQIAAPPACPRSEQHVVARRLSTTTATVPTESGGALLLWDRTLQGFPWLQTGTLPVTLPRYAMSCRRPPGRAVGITGSVPPDGEGIRSTAACPMRPIFSMVVWSCCSLGRVSSFCAHPQTSPRSETTFSTVRTAL